MIYRKILYFLFLVFAAGLILFFQPVFWVLLLLLMILLPIVLFLLLIWSRRMLSFSLGVREVSPEQFEYRITVKNRSPLPLSQCRIRLTCNTFLYGEENSREIVFPIGGKGEYTLSGMMEIPCCGLYSLSLSKIVIYDWMLLSKLTVRQTASTDFFRWPDLNLGSPHFSFQYVPSEDNGIPSYDKKGVDYSQMIGVKDYAEGDRLQWIHWKLSSKTDQIIVKDFGHTYQQNITMIVELSAGMSKEKVHSIFSAAASICSDLIRSQCPLTICWYHTQEKILSRYELHETSELFEMYRHWLSLPLCQEQEQGVALSQYEESDGTQLIYLTGEPLEDSNPAEIYLKSFRNPVTVLSILDQGEEAKGDDGGIRFFEVTTSELAKQLPLLEW